MRYRDQNGQGLGDIIDLLTMYPGARRRVASMTTRFVLVSASEISLTQS
jgi:hypothetical protein